MDPDKILYNSLKSDNSPNLLLYGYGTYNKLMNTLNSIHKLTNKTKIVSGDIIYYKTNIYYEFNLESIKSKNYTKFMDIINELIISKNYFSENNHKTIILNNFNRIKLYLQNILRVIFEKYRETTIFIIITNNYTSVIRPLRSRVLCVRFPQIKNKEIRQILYQKIKPSKISDEFYDFIYTLEDKNEINLSLEARKEIENYINPYLITSYSIIQIYEKKINRKNYEDLKTLSYNIIKFNLEIPKFYKIFLSELLKQQSIRDENKFKLIQLFADSEYNYNKSYRSIIILESLLFNVYKIICLYK